MKRFFGEFREFINKGNLLGIAVGFVMGVTFAALITSFVDNVIMPIIAIPFGEPNFDSVMVWTVNDSVIHFGTFITAAVTFVAVAFTLFFLLKAYNKATGGSVTAPANEIVLLTGILEEMKALNETSRRGGAAPGSPPPPPPPGAPG